MSPRRRSFWSNVAAVAYKEAAVIRHDRPFLAVVFLQPLTQFIIFAVLSNVPHNVPWAVLDRSATAVSRQLVEEVRTSGYFLRPTRVHGYAEGRALLATGDALALVVVPEDFARRIERGSPEVQVLLDGTDPISAARIGGSISAIASALRPPGARPAVATTGPVPPPTGPIQLRQRFWFNPTLADREFFLVVFAAVLLTNLCLSATSLALTGEREDGTYEQMLALPTTPVEIVLGKLVPYVVLCYVDVLIAVVPGALMFGLWPAGGLLAIFVVTFPFVLATMGIGTLISSLSHSSAQSVFLSVFIILPSFVLSGLMMPYRLMPDGIRHLGALLPTRWYQLALRGIYARGASLLDVAVPFLILTVMFAVVLAAIARRMKPRLA